VEFDRDDRLAGEGKTLRQMPFEPDWVRQESGADGKPARAGR
jgi:hypothetical protein